MTQLNHQQYDQLERAVADGTRVAIFRRGTEYILIPERIALDQGREVIVARNPTTGDVMRIALDDVDSLVFVR